MAVRRRGRRDRRLRQLHRRPDRGRRDPLRGRRTRRTRPSNVMCVGLARGRRARDRRSRAPRTSGRCMVLYRRGHRARRDRRGVACWRRATLEEGAEESPPVRADRRPVRREAPDRGLARADRPRPARGPAGPGRRRHHVRRERVGRARRDGRRAGPRRGAAPRGRAWRPSRSSRASRRSGCSRSCTRRGWPRSEAVCARWGLTTAVIAELVEGGGLTVTLAGETVAEVPGAVPRRRRSRVRPPDRGARRRASGGGVRRSGVRCRSRSDLRRGVLRGADVAERREQAVGLRAVRLDRAGTDRGRRRQRRRPRPRPGHDEGARALE